MNRAYLICFLCQCALLGSIPINVMFFANLITDPYNMWLCWSNPSTANEVSQVAWLVASVWFSYRCWPFDSYKGGAA